MTTTTDSATQATAWSKQAAMYAKGPSRLTEMHALDMITLLQNDLLQAKTVLEVGCGTGAFARAYLEYFPNGISGQTVIMTDLAEGMLEKTKEVIGQKKNGDTTFQFQVEDGTKLDGISDESVDLVISMFGIFLIPDQDAALSAVRRVLKKPNGVFANGSWVFSTKLGESLKSEGLGVSLQVAFETSMKALNPNVAEETPYARWGDRESIVSMLSSKTYGFAKPTIYRSVHSNIWQFDILWNMMLHNPVSNLKEANEDDVANAKRALIDFVKSPDGGGIEGPIVLWAASNLSIARGLS